MVVKLVDMGNRGDLTNEQWERIEPLLPKSETKRRRPAQDHRQLLNGILWVLRTGAPWRDMPDRYGKWTTIYSRFQRWRKLAVWDKMFAELQTALDVESNVDWEIHFIDLTTVRAHQHVAGAKKVVQNKRL
jgi:transposase